MPGLDRTGPEGKGRFSGRGLGHCGKEASEEDLIGRLGKGMAKRRRVEGGDGKGRRLKSGRSI